MRMPARYSSPRQKQTRQVCTMMAPAMGTPPIGVWQCPPKMGAGGPQGPEGEDRGGTRRLPAGRCHDRWVATQVFLAVQTGQGQGPSFSSNARVYVLKERGLPRRVEMLDASDQPTMTMDYRDCDAPITIQLPQCGQKS